MRKMRKIIVMIIGIISIITGLAIMTVADAKQSEIYETEEYFTDDYEMYRKYEQVGGTFCFIGGLIIVFGIVIPFLIERKQKQYKNKAQETQTLIGQTK